MSEQNFAVAEVARGCGDSRTKGDAYWETARSPKGKPIEFWIVDPPVKIDPDVLRISPQGVTLLEDKNGVHHVLDWIGAMHYPNITDFLEEARRFGVSRKCELSANEYALLSPESKLICIHSAAHLDEPAIHWGARIGMGDEFFAGRYKWDLCPKDNIEHDINREAMLSFMADPKFKSPMCAGLWWEDCMFVDPIEKDSRLGIRTMPAFRYRCAASPASPWKQTPRSPAIFASFPFGRIAIVEDPEGGEHEEKLEKIKLHEDMLVEVVRA